MTKQATVKVAAQMITFPFDMTFRVRVSPFMDTWQEAESWAQAHGLEHNTYMRASNWEEHMAYDNQESPVWNNKSVAQEVLDAEAAMLA